MRKPGKKRSGSVSRRSAPRPAWSPKWGRWSGRPPASSASRPRTRSSRPPGGPTAAGDPRRAHPCPGRRPAKDPDARQGRRAAPPPDAYPGERRTSPQRKSRHGVDGGAGSPPRGDDERAVPCRAASVRSCSGEEDGLSRPAPPPRDRARATDRIASPESVTRASVVVSEFLLPKGGTMSPISPQARQELVTTVAERYQRSTPAEKRWILDEFVALTGYHRKHAIRVLNGKLGNAGGTAGTPVCVRRGSDRRVRRRTEPAGRRAHRSPEPVRRPGVPRTAAGRTAGRGTPAARPPRTRGDPWSGFVGCMPLLPARRLSRSVLRDQAPQLPSVYANGSGRRPAVSPGRVFA